MLTAYVTCIHIKLKYCTHTVLGKCSKDRATAKNREVGMAQASDAIYRLLRRQRQQSLNPVYLLLHREKCRVFEKRSAGYTVILLLLMLLSVRCIQMVAGKDLTRIKPTSDEWDRKQTEMPHSAQWKLTCKFSWEYRVQTVLWLSGYMMSQEHCVLEILSPQLQGFQFFT